MSTQKLQDLGIAEMPPVEVGLADFVQLVQLVQL